MNGDVAKLVMDKQTTASMDGIVVIDHYVATPEQLALDIRRIAEGSGGNVVLGEFGVPIPNIHGIPLSLPRRWERLKGRIQRRFICTAAGWTPQSLMRSSRARWELS